MVSSSDETVFSQAVRALIPKSFACKINYRIVREMHVHWKLRNKEILNKKELHLTTVNRGEWNGFPTINYDLTLKL